MSSFHPEEGARDRVTDFTTAFIRAKSDAAREA